MRSLCAALALVAACTSGGSAKPTPLAKDLATICNAVELAGAGSLEPADRTYTIAQWLPEHLGDEGKAWLLAWAQLGDDWPQRRLILERDARAAGIADCALLAMW